jgi:hypothetical protein
MAELLAGQQQGAKPAKTEADLAQRKAELSAQLDALRRRREAADDAPPPKARE